MKCVLVCLLTITIIACTFPGCTDNVKGEEDKEYELISKEKFIEYIENNDVDVTMEDFKDVDIEDFIATNHITEEWVKRLNLSVLLEHYLAVLESNKRPTYLAREIVSVDSTDEEFKEFKNRFIYNVNGLVGDFEYAGSFDQYLTIYAFDYIDEDREESRERLYIGQTKYLGEYVTSNYDNPDWCYVIFLPMSSDGLVYEQSFSYNKDKKYFLVLNQYAVFDELIRTFTETE